MDEQAKAQADRWRLELGLFLAASLRQAAAIAEQRLLCYPFHVLVTAATGWEVEFTIAAQGALPKGNWLFLTEIEPKNVYPLTLTVRELNAATGSLGDCVTEVTMGRDWIQ